MKTVRRITTLCLAWALLWPCVCVLAGDAEIVLDSTDGSTGFAIKDANNKQLMRVNSAGKVDIGYHVNTEPLTVKAAFHVDGQDYRRC